MEQYTIETLLPLNAMYQATHGVSQTDVELANMYKALIESSRTADKVQVGDIVELTTEYGDYHANAHIEKWFTDGNYWSVCKNPHTPFVWPTRTGKNIETSTSGGPWTSVPDNLRYIGKRKKVFKDWGHAGSCANGAVRFEAEVNVWEYVQEQKESGVL